MNADQPFYVSAEKLEKLQAELQELKTVKRQDVANKIQEAQEMGDLSENAAYTEAKDEQAFLEGKIMEIETMLQNAVIIAEDHTHNSKEVKIGSTIKVKNDKEHEFTIVGFDEADPSAGKISNESPLGQAFLGRRLGDKVEVTVPKGKIMYKILEIQ
ncbi:transcription elongation factor GreA [Candidatus Uhrbacteria bacterium]|nr:transcription elongation factor GreA [Candidatus Uhrbacteria bacterium]